jgi:hypothetical protein
MKPPRRRIVPALAKLAARLAPAITEVSSRPAPPNPPKKRKRPAPKKLK